MDALTYFATQSPITDPGANSSLFSDLPKTASELCGVIQGLCLDYQERYKYPIQNERLLETNLRSVSAILNKIIKLDKHPLTEARPVDRRFMAMSSHFVSLFCSIARYHGIPARKRVGFVPGVNGTFHSHDIAEYWDATAGCWQKADPMGLPVDKFVTAAQAWQACRTGESDPEIFEGEMSCGMDVVRSNLLLDLAAMEKIELLNWDRYGWMLRPFEEFSDRAWEILDRLAVLLLDGDASLDELHALYLQEEGIQVPRVIFCNTPVVPPHKVELAL